MSKTGMAGKMMLAIGLLAGLAACGGDDNGGGSGGAPSVVGDTIALTAGNRLITFNRATPATLRSSVEITGLATGETLLGIDVRPADGVLYALSSNRRILTINASGVATLKSTLAADTVNDTTPDFTTLDGTDFGLDFNPVPDRLRVVSNTGQNLRINVDTGATITDGAINTATVPRLGTTAVAYTNSIGGGGATSLGTTLFYLDSTSDSLLTTADPNAGTVTVVGALGADAGTVNGFDIDGRNNTAIIAIAATGGSSLRTVNLATGALSASLGIIGGGEAVRGLAVNAAPRATVFGVTNNGNLVSFLPSTPGTIIATTAITGLMGGETVLDIDYRPFTRQLYALTTAGRLYTLNVATGAATAASTLVASAGDDNPFVMLAADAQFGIDFNPVPDRLRVVDTRENNLRIEVSGGGTTTDSNLTPAGDTFAAAYTNSFIGPAATTLYAVDATLNSLVGIGANPAVTGDCPATVGNPNCGVVTPVGPLTVDVTTLGDIDIAGGANGFALGAFQTGAASSQSGLYRINLATGAATLIGNIGANLAPPLVGITIRIQ
ncbi:MAG: DUF4394 domain-containing protein [Panacagrimonas sp.]